MKRIARMTAAAALVVFVGLQGATLAGREARGRGRVDVQTFVTTEDVTGGGSRQWEPVQGSRVHLRCPAGRAATATASIVLDPGPAARLRVETLDPTVSTPSGPARGVARPGAIPVAASRRARPVSFTFAIPRLPGSHAATVRLAWRSPSGDDLGLSKATLRVLWDRSDDPCR